MTTYKPRTPQPIKVQAPVACCSEGDMGRWEMTVTIKGGNPLSTQEPTSLRDSVAEVGFYLEKWRRENT